MSASRKGSGHGKKRHYGDKGGVKPRVGKQRKLIKNTFQNREEIMYRSAGLVKYGYILSGEDNTVKSCLDEEEGIITLDSGHYPKSLEKLRCCDVSQLDIGRASFVLTEYIFKKCVVIGWQDEQHVWLRVGDEIKMVSLASIFAIPDNYNEYRKTLVDVGDTNLIQKEIQRYMYDMVDELKTSNSHIPQLQAQLLETQTQLQNMRGQLNKSNETIESQVIQIQQQEGKLNELSNTVTQLTNDNHTLTQNLKHKESLLDIEFRKTPLLLERQSGSSGGVLRTRAKGSTGKFVTSVIVSMPTHSRPSAGAFQATLDKRVFDLKKVCE